jgi:hypothetical protein
MLGNLASVLVPHRIAPGSLKPTKTSTLTVCLIFISRLLFPVAMVPIFLAPGLALLFARLEWFAVASTNLVVSVVVLILLTLLYRFSLDPLGEMLQRRERQILDVVTQEVE